MQTTRGRQSLLNLEEKHKVQLVRSYIGRLLFHELVLDLLNSCLSLYLVFLALVHVPLQIQPQFSAPLSCILHSGSMRISSNQTCGPPPIYVPGPKRITASLTTPKRTFQILFSLSLQDGFPRLCCYKLPVKLQKLI